MGPGPTRDQGWVGKPRGPHGTGGGASGNGIGDTKRAKLRLTRPLPLGTWDGTAAMPQCPMPCHATAGTKSRGLPACLPACLPVPHPAHPTNKRQHHADDAVG